MPTSYTKEPKPGNGGSSTLTWNDMTDTWDNTTGTWNSSNSISATAFTKESKPTTAFTKESKP